jgi:hypothetical protein
MTTGYAIDEIRKDAHELTKIAIEDSISKTQAINMFYPVKHGSVNHWSMEKIIEDVKQYSDDQRITKRYHLGQYFSKIFLNHYWIYQCYQH